MPVTGRTSDDRPYSGAVYLPEAFPYLLMKLHAFHDRKEDVNKNLGKHHALDAYTIVGMMTESEYERAKAFGAADHNDVHVKQARSIVSEAFSSETALGVLRLRDHPLFRADFRIKDFIEILHEVFG